MTHYFLAQWMLHLVTPLALRYSQSILTDIALTSTPNIAGAEILQKFDRRYHRLPNFSP
jgi:hypothetical protein